MEKPLSLAQSLSRRRWWKSGPQELLTGMTAGVCSGRDEAGSAWALDTNSGANTLQTRIKDNFFDIGVVLLSAAFAVVMFSSTSDAPA
jgi:hypothetical protein